MVDNTDDWWDPTAPVWYGPAPKNITEYRIQRAAKTPLGGSPGFIVQWKPYQVFTTSKARDDALYKLSKAHPKWRLRASTGNPYLEALGYGGPLPTEGINKG